MTDLSPLVRLFDSLDRRLERCRPTWWGAVVTDSRLRTIYDANYARVDGASPNLALEDVERELLPAARESGARHIHVVSFDPPGTARLVDQMKAGGGKITVDTAMRRDLASRPQVEPTQTVDEVDGRDEAFWRRHREALVHFDITDDETADQLTFWQREIQWPAGKRWFTVGLDGQMAGFGSIYVQDSVAYVDDVVTFPESRRRGIATSIVLRMIEESRVGGATSIYLLADEPGPIRLYERLGFRAVGEVVASLRPMP